MGSGTVRNDPVTQLYCSFASLTVQSIHVSYHSVFYKSFLVSLGKDIVSYVLAK